MCWRIWCVNIKHQKYKFHNILRVASSDLISFLWWNQFHFAWSWNSSVRFTCNVIQRMILNNLITTKWLDWMWKMCSSSVHIFSISSNRSPNTRTNHLSWRLYLTPVICHPFLGPIISDESYRIMNLTKKKWGIQKTQQMAFFFLHCHTRLYMCTACMGKYDANKLMLDRRKKKSAHKLVSLKEMIYV